MEEFINSLNNLYNNQNSQIENCEGSTFFTGNEAEKVSLLACKYLIDNNGQCNFGNIKQLRNLGYKVYAGEKDSFGWLIGCIKKNNDNRILTYG